MNEVDKFTCNVEYHVFSIINKSSFLYKVIEEDTPYTFKDIDEKLVMFNSELKAILSYFWNKYYKEPFKEKINNTPYKAVQLLKENSFTLIKLSLSDFTTKMKNQILDSTSNSK